MRAHYALLLNYVPPKSPQAHPLETPLELGDPNRPTNPHNVAKAVNGNRNRKYTPGVFRLNTTSQRMRPMEAMGMLST